MKNHRIAIPNVKRRNYDNAVFSLKTNVTNIPSVENRVDRITIIRSTIGVTDYP